MTQTTRLYNVPTSFFGTSEKKERKKERQKEKKKRWRKSAKQSGEKSRGRGARSEGAEKHDTQAVISPTANCMEFRKLSVTQQFRSGLAARLHSAAAAAPAWEAGRGRGGLTEFARGQQRPGPTASRSACVQAPGPERRLRPCNDFTVSEERPPGPRLPRAPFGPVHCVAEPTRTRPRSPRVPEASERRGLATGEGLELAKTGQGDCSLETAGRRGAVLLRTPTFHPPKGEGPERGARFATPRADAGGGRAGWSSPARRGTPAQPSPVPGLCPSAQCALRPAWPWLSGPCPSRAAGHPRRGQWRPRGPAPRGSQPATPSAFRALGASSPGPRETLVPSTASSTISSSLSMAAGDPAQLGAAPLPPVPPGAPGG